MRYALLVYRRRVTVRNSESMPWAEWVTNLGASARGVLIASGVVAAVGVAACSGGEDTADAVGASGAAAETASGGAGSIGGSSGGGNAGTGCGGPLETIEPATKLCIAKMVEVTPPTGIAAYSIDATEVTREQYEAWLATNPALPDAADPACGWKAAGSYAATPSCSESFTASYCANGCERYPYVCADWCDAYAYCAAVGKRLCGAIGGGQNPVASYADANASQWYRACTSGGTNSYPYGIALDDKACNGQSYSFPDSNYALLPVGSLTTCQSTVVGYEGVFDQSGNAWEWEDSCDGDGEAGTCLQRGGGYDYDFNFRTRCDFLNDTYARSARPNNVGIRCCSK